MCCGKFIKKIQTSLQKLFPELLQAERASLQIGHRGRSPVNASLVMHLPAASIWGSDIPLPSACLRVRLIYLTPACRLVPRQYHHGCEVLYPLYLAQMMVGSKTGSASLEELRGSAVMACAMGGVKSSHISKNFQCFQ